MPDANPRRHEKTDMLVMHSTVSGKMTFTLSSILIYVDIVFISFVWTGYVSYRDEEQGSWFIQDLVSTFQEHAHHMTILDMLTEVFFIIIYF